MAMGMRSSRAASATTGTSTRRISSEAYAVDEIASEASTASAVGLPNRSRLSANEGIGRPTRRRFS